MALYYKLDGQEGVCGPLPIDRETHGMHEVAVRTARSSGLTRLRLAFDVNSMRSGEPSVVLHSGVQVRSPIYGFSDLELVKLQPCNPPSFDLHKRSARDGLIESAFIGQSLHDGC